MNDFFSDFPDFIRQGNPEFLLHLLRLTGGDKQAFALVSPDLCTLACTPAVSRILGPGTFHSLPDILSGEACHIARSCLQNQTSFQQADTIDGLSYLITFYPLGENLLLLFSPVSDAKELSSNEFFYQNQIRQNLSNIYTASQMLSPESPESTEKYIKLIQKNALQVIRSQKHLQMLSPFFTQERLRLVLDDLAEVIRGISSHGKRALAAQGRELSVDVPKSLLLIFDREAISIAVYNLLINSVRYTSGNIALSLKKTNSRILIQVADQGDGIPEQALNELQNASVLSGPSLSAVGRGIVLAHKIAMLHHGNLLMSQTDTGFCVTMSLPRVLPEQSNLVQAPLEYKLSDYPTEDVEFFSLL